MTINESYHVPVLLDACLEGLQIQPNGIYVDVTFGGGGHSRAIFKQLKNTGRLIAFDQDPDALANLWEAPNFNFVGANFSFLQNHLRMLGIKQVDGILADLGVSSALAAQLVRQREHTPIDTTFALIKALERFAPKFKEHKFYAQVFQAFRIEVNQELQVLKDFLEQSANVLKPGGYLVVLSYHSLEDRLVKNFMKRGSFSGEIDKDFFGNVNKPFTEVNRHPIVANELECVINSRARSAKLRIARRNG